MRWSVLPVSLCHETGTQGESVLPMSVVMLVPAFRGLALEKRKDMTSRFAVLVVFLLFSGWFQCVGAYPGSMAAYPAFPAVDLKDENGQLVSTEDWSNEGFPIVVVMWANWSSPSKKLLSDLKATFDAVYDKTYWQIYAVAVDDERTVGGVRPFFKENGAQFKLFFDHKEALVNALSPGSLPAVYVLNADHEIAWSKAGYALGMDSEIAASAKIVAQETDPTIGYSYVTEPFNNNARNWLVGRNDTWKSFGEIRDGSYFLSYDGEGLIWSKVELPELRGKTEFRIEAKIKRLKGGEDQSYGIVWGDPQSSITFDFGTNEIGVFVRKFDNGALSFPKAGNTPCDGPESPTPLLCGALPGQFNTFSIERYGNFYVFRMNGDKMAEVEWDYPLVSQLSIMVWKGCSIQVEEIIWGYPAP